MRFNWYFSFFCREILGIDLKHITLDDTNMRTRLLAFIAECNDPFAREVCYHPECWRKYVRPIDNSSSTSLPLQGVRRQEVDQKMLQHVKSVIFEENEPRTLTGLLKDYNQLLDNHNFQRCEKSSNLRRMLEKEFGDRICFHVRFQKNQSTIVYDVSNGGSFIEAAINAWGVSEDNLINNVAKRLESSLKESTPLSWPPHAEDLESVAEPPLQLVKLLTWLQNTAKKIDPGACDDSRIVALADILHAFITKKRSIFQVGISTSYTNTCIIF